jgi:hypothetical protein
MPGGEPPEGGTAATDHGISVIVIYFVLYDLYIPYVWIDS